MSAPGTTTFTTPDEVLRAVDAALAASRTEQAFQLVEGALQSGMVHPALFGLRAAWLEEQGRPLEALADLQRARNLAPRDVTILNALGECLTTLGRLPEAIANYDAAIALKDDYALFHYNKGIALELLGQIDAARGSHERSVDLDPSSSRPLARLAMLHADAKRWNEARELAEMSLALNPLMVTAEFALLEADLAEGSLVEAEARAKSISEDSRHALHARALAQSYLADALDGQDRIADAFEASLAHCTKIHSVYQSQLRTPGVETALERVRRLTHYFRGTPSWPAGEPESRLQRPPVFVVGFPHSGVQLLRNLFELNPGCVTDEHDAIESFAKTFASNDSNLDQLTQLTAERRTLLQQSYWQGTRSHNSGAGQKIFIDCLPFNLIHLCIVAKLFPGAKTIHVVRDPRDVILSCIRNRSGTNAYTYELLSLEGAATFYDAVMELADVYREKLPLGINQVRSEDLDQGGAREVFTYAGLVWNDATNAQIAIMPESRSDWRRYADQLAPVMPILKPWIERLGYPEN